MKPKFDISQAPRRNPYVVPNNYFDSLASRVMACLPEETVSESKSSKSAPVSPQQFQTAKSMKSRVGWRIDRRYFTWAATTAAAACLVGAAFLLNPSQHIPQATAPQATAHATVQDNYYEDQYSEEALDYACLDNGDVYAYLSGDSY